ncbi:MAG: NADPH-dependent FMN reductase [Flavipsychrobacter sp.]
MPHIVILSASVRTGRASHRVALFFEKYFATHTNATTEILDLNAYKFPIFEERLQYMPDPSADVLEVSEKIKKADGVLIVTPEYNGGYPASLKNFIDLLYSEWRRKPLAISTVSNGNFGGTQVITSLLFSLWKIGSWIAPAMFPVPNVHESFTEEGNATDPEATGKRAKRFVDELLWCIEAHHRMEAQ